MSRNRGVLSEVALDCVYFELNGDKCCEQYRLWISIVSVEKTCQQCSRAEPAEQRRAVCWARINLPGKELEEWNGSEL